MSKFIVCLTITLGLLVLFYAHNKTSEGTPSMVDYCYIPPHVAQEVKPFVLFALDMYEYMGEPIYPGNYNNEKTYYGYFNPNKCYQGTKNGFVEVVPQGGCSRDTFVVDKNNVIISGNILNYATTTRADAVKKIIGARDPQYTANKARLESVGGNRIVQIGSYQINISKQGQGRVLKVEGVSQQGIPIIVDVPIGEAVGLIDEFCQGTVGSENNIVTCKLAMAALRMSGSGGSEFQFTNKVGDEPISVKGFFADFMSLLKNADPSGDRSHIGEGLEKAKDYFMTPQPDKKKDPWYIDKDTSAWCRKAFVLLLSVGDWSEGVDPVRPAREMNLQDLRTDLEGIQSVKTYVVFAFGSEAGRKSMLMTAIYGGFEDLDQNKWPRPFTSYPEDSRRGFSCDSNVRGSPEWDTLFESPADCVPYNFYYAVPTSTDEDPIERLRLALRRALYDILRRASSAAAVACLTTQKGFSTLVLQPYYYPKFESQQGERGWLGFFKAFWVDLGKKVGLREDTVVNKVLNLMGDLVDKVIKFVSGPNEVKVAVLEGSEDECSLEAFKDINQVLPVFDSGCLLAETNPSQRRILVNLGNVTAEFQSSNATLLSELQQIWKTVDPNVNETVVKCVIEYLRGNDAPMGCSGVRYVQRPRTVLKSEVCREGQGTIVWRLGDIIASTPSVVSDKPTNIYHLKYGDSSYRDFVNSPAYRNRPSLAFVGANDGMLHAFRIGYLQMTQDPRAPAKLLDAPGAETNGYVGREEWAFIPKNAIPYLLWYGDTAYCHVPTVDYRTLVVDVKLDDQWKTVLVGAMGFGGKELGGFSSSVFVLDITDPLNPQVLWERPLPDKTLTLSMPAVIKVRDKWYVVLGTGPKDPHGATFSTTSKIYFFQLKDGFLVREILVTNKENVAIGDLMPVDVDEDYSDDAIYFGTYGGPTDPKGSFWRLRLRNGQRYLEVSELGSSDLSKAMDLSGFWPKGSKSLPVFAAPAFARGQGDALWVYFGTGRFLTGDDKAFGYDNYLIGFKDGAWDTKYNSSPTYGKSDLVDTTSSQVIAQVLLRKPVCICDIGGCKTEWVVYETTGSMGPGVSRGWYFNLGREILFSQPAVMGKTVEALSYVPSNDICEFTGRTNLISLYYESGTAYFRPVVLSPLATEEVQGQPGKVVLLPKVSLGYGSPPYGNPFQTVSGVNPREYSKLVQVSGTLVQVRQQVAYKFRGRVLAWVER